MTNDFYNRSGNPSTHSRGLSSIARNEYLAIERGFDLVARLRTTGTFTTTFAQSGTFTFSLPVAAGTLALIDDVNAAGVDASAALSAEISARVTADTMEFNRATGVESQLSSAISEEASRATAAENANTAAIATEISRATAAEVRSMNNTGRNLLHNSMWRVRQRGNGPFTSGYTADRWKIEKVGAGTISVTFGTFADLTRQQIGDEAARTFMSAAVVGSGSAGDYIMFVQPLEDVSQISNKTVTVSFWAYGSVAGLKIGVGIQQSFGSGGSPSADVAVAGQSVTLTASPARYFLTFAVPSTDGKTFGTTVGTSYTRLMLAFSSGASNATRLGSPGVQSGTFVMWGLQEEFGGAATPLDKQDLQLESIQCQRFLQGGRCIVSGYGVTGSGASQTYTLPGTMRTLPVVTAAGPSLTNISGFTITTLDGNSVWFRGTVTATGTWELDTGSFLASSEL